MTPMYRRLRGSIPIACELQRLASAVGQSHCVALLQNFLLRIRAGSVVLEHSTNDRPVPDGDTPDTDPPLVRTDWALASIRNCVLGSGLVSESMRHCDAEQCADSDVGSHRREEVEMAKSKVTTVDSI